MRAVALGLVLCANALHAQLSRIDSLVPALMRRYDVPGLALAVVRGDSVLLLRGYGIARVTDSARVDPSRTIFRTASVAKLFVATAVMQQIEAGKLQPNVDVNRYLGFRIPATWPDPITLEQLLRHTAGFDAIAVVLAALVVLSWWQRWWDVLRRGLMTSIAVGALMTVALLIQWNYLPAVL